MKLPFIFSDNALFMGGSELEVRGTTEISVKIHAEIRSEGTTYSAADVMSDGDGSFCLVLKCPESSFTKYELAFDDGEELVFHGILFGGLWLASGQSNMEFQNSQQPEYPEYLEKYPYGEARVYHVERRPGDDNFPFCPSSDRPGEWIALTDIDALSKTSAIATVFAGKLFECLGKNVPVGIINCSYGGTLIECWIPRDRVEADEELTALLKEKGRFVNESEWNTKGWLNFQQPFSQYNDCCASVLGVKTRGLLWYQGESNCCDGSDYYHTLYRAFHSIYAELFGFDKDNYPMISSLLYPWVYELNRPSIMSGINDVFVRAANEEPDIYSFVPTYDLSPIWSSWCSNHPIHPAHKYDIALRMVTAAMNLVYGGDGQKVPATVDSYEIIDGRIRVKLKNCGDCFFAKGKKPEGFSICGKNKVYVPAEAEIVGKGTVEIFSEKITEPVAAAYNYSGYDLSGNMWAGEFPVTPFIVNDGADADIRLRPWFDPNNDTMWVWIGSTSDTEHYCHMVPVWTACEGSTVCHDRVFLGEGKTLMVKGNAECFGAYVSSYPYYELDLHNYESVVLNCFSPKDNLSAFVEVYVNGEVTEPLRFDGILEEKTSKGIKRFRFDVSSLAKCDVAKLAFKFSVSDGIYPVVNILGADMIPRK